MMDKYKVKKRTYSANDNGFSTSREGEVKRFLQIKPMLTYRLNSKGWISEKWKKNLFQTNDDRFPTLWGESENGSFKPVSFGILLPKWDQRKRFSCKTIVVSESGWTKRRVIIPLPRNSLWLNKMKGYHNPSLWQNSMAQNEGLS